MSEPAEAKEKQYKIFVNGTEHEVDSEVVTFEQVVALAYPTPPTPDTVFSVSYEKAKSKPHEGDLVATQSVEIKNETEFDVTPTGRS